MTSLDDYLSGDFHIDRQEAIAVDTLINDAATTLLASHTQNGWPYKVEQDTPVTAPTALSHNTTAMAILAIERLLGATKKRPNELDALDFPVDGLDSELRKKLKQISRSSYVTLFKKKGALLEDGAVATKSKTFGLDDILTLSYLLELAQIDRDAKDRDREAQKALVAYARKKRRQLAGIDPSDRESYDQFFEFPAPDSDNPPPPDVMSNAFIPLRAVQAIRSADALLKLPTTNLTAYRRYFEGRLHEQLSYSSIPDSRFDPAELAFCLEGLLLTQAEAVDRTLMSRVTEVLTHAQSESAFWRPTRPFLANERGMVLFPVSVEVANSFIRACELFDRRRLYETFASSCVGLFRRYWRWLRARTVRFQAAGSGESKYFVGWHSEHVNEPGLLHTWETSQVVEFLINYRRILKGHIARTTLIRAKFSIRDPERKEPRKRQWETIAFDFEPVSFIPKLEVYKSIGDEFVAGWLNKAPSRFSMLLYGPPGTGKTTVAENIADVLDFKLITITVSDFLRGGEVQLEANAKAIFDVLTSQSDCVILFDEIDNFLLDRDSTKYGKQTTIFQFMTPGMLTKLNDLRRAKRVIFVIATNYEYRIDPAIKRPGRIDRAYLLLPPDKEGRKRILTGLIEREWAVKVKNRDARSPDIESVGVVPVLDVGTMWPKLLSNSLFLGYGDMVAAVKGCKKDDLNLLAENLKSQPRTTRLETYSSRLDDPDAGQNVLHEFLALLNLALEVGQTESLEVNGQSTALASQAAKLLPSYSAKSDSERVKAAALELLK